MSNETFEKRPGSQVLFGLDRADYPQDPFFPQQDTFGPAFLDTEACLCQLHPTPALLLEKRADEDSIFWRCVGNQTEGTENPTSGKWFKTQHGDGDIKGPTDLTELPIYDASNPPKFGQQFRWNNDTSEMVEASDGFSVWDNACTGQNRSSFSTSYYRAVEQLDNDETPVDAAPCWRPGAVPLLIQDVADWKENGCAEGFYCPNNTVNALPQYCPPITECQMGRLGGRTCELNGRNIGMGPFEPVVCQAGWYCPPEKKGTETLMCPSGTYCQPGASTPTPCSVLSICPEGSTYQRFLLPVVILIIVDVLLVVGLLLLGYRSRVKNITRAHGTTIVKRSKTFKAMMTGYAPLSDGQHDRMEMGQVNSPIIYGPDGSRRDVWSGFETANPDDSSLEASFTPEIKAFVESMRKATDAADIGLSFGYSQLAFQPKKSTKPILQNMTGSIKRGSLTAIMGGSGAGKSTFVNVLMGKTINTSGSVSINDIPGKLKRYKKLIGYVPQDDIILPELTVYENILHSARIRLPRSWKDSEIQNHVDAVIDCLELSHVRDSLVGSVGKPVISGGQRKRASIGMELAAAPMAIFLDEPTSGLDATAASSIMRTLKAIARLGISVIVIIHQPRMEIFDMLDDLILLANGQLIYEGPESQVRPFFERVGFIFPPHANFGDVVTDIITGNGRAYKPSGDISKEALIAHWAHHTSPSPSLHPSSPTCTPSTPGGLSTTLKRLSLLPPTMSTPLSPAIKSSRAAISTALSHRGASLPHQTALCLSRSLLQQRRALSTLLFELALASLAGFLLGLAESPKKGVLFTGPYAYRPYAILSVSNDFKSAPEMALLVAIAIGLVSAAPGVKVFSEEMLLHRRESEAGHSRLAYFVAKTAGVLPRMVLACLHFSTLLGLLSVPVVGWGVSFLANLLYFWCIYGLASCVSMLVRREDAPLFATMISLIVGILSGAAPPLRSVRGWGMEWLWRASPGTWLAELYFGQLVSPFRYLYDVELAAEATGFHLDWLWRNMLILAGIGMVYRLLAFLGLFVGKRMRL